MPICFFITSGEEIARRLDWLSEATDEPRARPHQMFFHRLHGERLLREQKFALSTFLPLGLQPFCRVQRTFERSLVGEDVAHRPRDDAIRSTRALR